jgi:hypothetical protein
MHAKETPLQFHKRRRREYQFTPRSINPVKIENVVVFSADETVRSAGKTLQAEMPWVRVDLLSNPAAVSGFRSDGPVVFILDDTGVLFVDTEKVRRENRNVVVVLLSFHELVHCAPPGIARQAFPYTAKADLVFAVNRSEFAPGAIMTSVVRAAEDLLNITEDAPTRRFIFLIVDDEPRWFSQFLPVLYGIIGQRASVKITRTYEETLAFLFGVEKESDIRENYRDSGFGDKVVCLIADLFFPKGGTIDSEAGKALIRLVGKTYPRIPIIIASKAVEAAELGDAGFVLPKGDPGSLETLRSHIRDVTGIGDFVIYDEAGREEYRLKDIREIYRCLLKADGEDREAARLRGILDRYGEKDKYSTWLYMHSFRELGDRLRPQRYTGKRLRTVLKRALKREILRMPFTPLVIDGARIFTLRALSGTLQTVSPEKIQPLSDSDVVSSWLDRQGYSELAEVLRPMHGKVPELRKTVAEIIEKWAAIYETREKERQKNEGRGTS